MSHTSCAAVCPPQATLSDRRDNRPVVGDRNLDQRVLPALTVREPAPAGAHPLHLEKAKNAWHSLR
jgi:hypothetical protein